MSKIKITCDSTCDLTKELYDYHHIDVIPLGVSMGDDFRLDTVNVTAQELYDYVGKSSQLPKTSAISIGDYMDLFRKYTEQGYQVIHISLSSELSSSYQNACIAAGSTGNVYVIDSQNLSSGSGHLALMAADLAAADYTAEEIRDALNEVKGNLDVSFVLQTLDYLYKGGRCSGLAVFGANIFKIRPEIIVSNGKMHVGKKYRGDMEKSIMSYIRGRLEGRTDIQLDRIFVTHSGVPKEIVNKAIALIRELQPFENITETVAGSTISSHCGPGCLGILFFKSGRKK